MGIDKDGMQLFLRALQEGSTLNAHNMLRRFGQYSVQEVAAEVVGAVMRCVTNGLDADADVILRTAVHAGIPSVALCCEGYKLGEEASKNETEGEEGA